MVQSSGLRNLKPGPGGGQAEIHSRDPISCGISATMALDRYSGGIFQQYKPDANINHIILVVGWGEDDDVPFWWVPVHARQVACTSDPCTGCRFAQEATPWHACCAVQRMGGTPSGTLNEHADAGTGHADVQPGESVQSFACCCRITEVANCQSQALVPGETSACIQTPQFSAMHLFARPVLRWSTTCAGSRVVLRAHAAMCALHAASCSKQVCNKLQCSEHRLAGTPWYSTLV